MDLCLAIDYMNCSIDELIINFVVGGLLGSLAGLLVWWVLDFMEWLETHHS